MYSVISNRLLVGFSSWLAAATDMGGMSVACLLSLLLASSDAFQPHLGSSAAQGGSRIARCVAMAARRPKFVKENVSEEAMRKTNRRIAIANAAAAVPILFAFAGGRTVDQFNAPGIYPTPCPSSQACSVACSVLTGFWSWPVRLADCQDTARRLPRRRNRRPPFWQRTRLEEMPSPRRLSRTELQG